MPISQRKQEEKLYGSFGKNLYRKALSFFRKDPSPITPDIVGGEIIPSQISPGKLVGNMNVTEGYLQSENFVTGSTGWRIDAEGDLEASSGTFRGALAAATGTIGGWNINSTSIYTGTEDHSGYTANAGDITIYSDGTDASIHAYNWYINTSGNLVTREPTITLNATSGRIGTATSGARIELYNDLLTVYDANNKVFEIEPTGGATSLTISKWYDSTAQLGEIFCTRTGASSGDTQRIAFQTIATTPPFLARLSVESGKSGGDLPAINVKGHLITDGEVMNDATTQWDVSDQGSDTFRYTYDGTGTDPDVDANLVAGDVVIISGFASTNNGTFAITAVGTDYFEITNASGSAENNITSATVRVIYDIGNSTYKFNDLTLAGSIDCVGLDAGSAKITSLATPTADTDAASKGYVDDQIDPWITASDSLQVSDDDEILGNEDTYTEKKASDAMTSQGTLRAKFDLKRTAGSDTIYGRIYVNDAAVGDEHSTTSATYVTFDDDINIDVDDTVEVYAKHDGSGSSSQYKVANFRLYWDSSTAKPYIDTRIDATQMVALEATVALFQANAATGTCTDPDNINDNNTGTFADFDGVNEYAEIDFGKVVSITQFRYYGNASHNEDGTYKIQYYDLADHAWTDWKTGIATRTASWSTLETVSTQFTDKVRIIATALDTGITPNKNKPYEFEIYY